MEIGAIQQGIIARLSMLRSNKTRVVKFNLRFRRRNQGSNERQILRHLVDGSILHSVYVRSTFLQVHNK